MKNAFILSSLIALSFLTGCVEREYYEPCYSHNYNNDDSRKPYNTIDTTTTDSSTTDSVFHPVTVSGTIGNYSYVDLGLSVLWATYNVGASAPEEFGNYYAWAETDTKDAYSYKTYKYYNLANYEYTKYSFAVGTQTTADKIVELDSADDAAAVNWGSEWRMPTKTEVRELAQNLKWQWISSFYGTNVAGFLGKSKINGNTIFLPATGYYNNYDPQKVGEELGYWTKTDNRDNLNAISFYGTQANTVPTSSYDCRLYGMAVRAVASK